MLRTRLAPLLITLAVSIVGCAGADRSPSAGPSTEAEPVVAEAPTPEQTPPPEMPISSENMAACRDATTLRTEHVAMLQSAVAGGGFLMSSGQATSIKLHSAHAAAVGPAGDVASGVGDIQQVVRDGLAPSGTQAFIDPNSAQRLLDAFDRLIASCEAESGYAAAVARPLTPAEHALAACFAFYKASGAGSSGSAATRQAFAVAIKSASQAAAGDPQWSGLPKSMAAVERGFSGEATLEELDLAIPAIDITSALCAQVDLEAP